MSYGEKIAELRKSKGMTQATLGAKLNVTYQAVSKWERDESDPDFATMSKIAKLFDVPLTYFEDTDGSETQTPSEQSEPQSIINEEKVEQETEVAAVSTEPSLLATPAHVAESSTAATSTPADSVVTSAPVKPATATAKSAANNSNSKTQAERILTYGEQRVIRRRNIGLIAGGAITLAALIGAILLIVNSSSPVNAGFAVGFCAVVLIFGYTFFSQLFWGGFIIDVVMLGGKIIGTPGIIFSFDLDGFIFLIAMKILFAVIKLIVFVLTIVFFVLVAIILSPFSFAPQIIKMSRGEELD